MRLLHWSIVGLTILLWSRLSAADIDIQQAQLFLDEEVIESTALVQRVIHQPVRHPRNPLFQAEEPWEGHGMNYLSGVFRDDESGLFRAWYVGTVGGKVPSMPKVFFPICLITSQDGLKWERPLLTNHAELTGRPNNIVLHLESGCIGAPNIIHTPLDTDRPWKLIIHHSPQSPCRYNVRLASSKDGISWRWENDQGFHAGLHDRLTAMHDPQPDQGPYVLFSRIGSASERFPLRYPDRVRVREIYQARLSADGSRLTTEPSLSLRPDLEDDPFVEFYHMSAFRYQSLYLGLLIIYHSQVDPSADVQLAVSRNAQDWQRVRPRTAFLPANPELQRVGIWDSTGIQPMLSPPILHDGALWFYYYGGPAFHGDRFLQGDYRLGLAKLRPDGFASLRAHWREGHVTTRPFEWKGGRLVVNYEILGGNGTREDAYLRAAILDESGQAIPGLSYAESDPLASDSIDALLTWSSKPQNLDSLIGKRLRLRIFLKEADIYSFRAVPTE